VRRVWRGNRRRVDGKGRGLGERRVEKVAAEEGGGGKGEERKVGKGGR